MSIHKIFTTPDDVAENFRGTKSILGYRAGDYHKRGSVCMKSGVVQVLSQENRRDHSLFRPPGSPWCPTKVTGPPQRQHTAVTASTPAALSWTCAVLLPGGATATCFWVTGVRSVVLWSVVYDCAEDESSDPCGDSGAFWITLWRGWVMVNIFCFCLWRYQWWISDSINWSKLNLTGKLVA